MKRLMKRPSEINLKIRFDPDDRGFEAGFKDEDIQLNREQLKVLSICFQIHAIKINHLAKFTGEELEQISYQICEFTKTLDNSDLI